MKRVLASSGYTIIEVMIVLVVSGGLLTSIATMISGQQNRTQFSTATREFESKLQDIFNDVESGVVPNKGNLSCSSNASDASVTISSGTAREQGTNQGCVVIGKAIQFYSLPGAGLDNQFAVMSIVGKRQYMNGTRAESVTDLSNAAPRAFWTGNPDLAADVALNSYDTGVINNGLQVSGVRYVGNATPKKALAMVANIGTGATKDGQSISSSDGGVRLAMLDVSNTSSTLNDLINSIPNLKKTSIDAAAKGAVVCLNEGSGGGSRSSAVAIGVTLDSSSPRQIISSGQRTSTEAFFDGDAKALGC